MQQRVEQLFTSRIAGWRERQAVSGRSGNLSYAELDQRSNALARMLQAYDVQAGAIVAFSAADATEFALAALAILKAGAAYLPIDARHANPRLEQILLHARPALLLASADFPAWGSIPALSVIRGFADPDVLAGFSSLAMPPAGRAEDIALVSYTSGSTGIPKGIEVTHLGIPGLVSDHDFVEFTPRDRVGQASNFSFDAATFEVWGALLNGACLVSIPLEQLLSAPQLQSFLHESGITILMLTTSLFNALGTSRPRAFSGLTTLVIGGEAADPAACARVLSSGGAPGRLINGYGPSETTTFATWHRISLADAGSGRVPIGKPIRGVSAWVADAAMERVADGVAGELLISGPCVARGYLRELGLTREKFLQSPAVAGTRVYRTGDMCRVRPDGAIEYIGRTDDQLKVRGFRVEPREVSALLRQLPRVADAVVLGRDGSFGTKELVAFVRGEALEATELRRQAIAVLPEYMLPALIQVVDAFPLMPNGKTDRGALLARARVQRQTGLKTPACPVEEELAAIWRRVLRVPEIGVDESLRDLGGDSISALDLMVEIERAFGCSIPAWRFTPAITIEQAAALIASSRAGAVTRFSGPAGNDYTTVFIQCPWAAGEPPQDIAAALTRGGAWHSIGVPQRLFADGAVPTVETMASELVTQLEALPRDRPFIFAGHSFSGVLACELARRIEPQVALLVLLDSHLIARRGLGAKLRDRARGLPRRLKGFARLDMRTRLARLKQKRTWLGDVDRGASVQAKLSPSERILQTCIQSLLRYKPGAYAGYTIRFKSRSAPETRDDFQVAEAGWDNVLRGRVEKHLIDADHLSIITDPASRLTICGHLRRVVGELGLKAPQ